ncbi:S8 family serine peptidase [Ornithinimicrobium cerasi]|uniref:S8 family serine peptidase n=1 Tax=Ornithinimicrobium cerasi TaxID=2248773 RepID=UPI00137B464E|nr:S8 family serine peptidase [Ornithinimicrobium cerasi]
MSRSLRTMVAAAATLGLCFPALAVSAQDDPSERLSIPGGPVSTDRVPEGPLADAEGKVTVSLRLSAPSLAEAVGEGAKQQGPALGKAAQRAHVASLERAQRGVAGRVKALGGEELATTQKAVNAVVVSVDVDDVRSLAEIPGVVSVRPVLDYELDLTETVPYIGATALHEGDPALTGEGISVAVLDSGIDYTHERLGGAGTAEAYAAAYGTSTGDVRNRSRDGQFPTAKVVEGFDFVGEVWPNGPAVHDPDPIDCGPGPIGCSGGHGTHVAAIVGGDTGVAPDVDLYAYKVCSAVSTSCNGVALLEGMEAAVDPDGDGSIDDAVDVINLSLGSAYGQIEDDLSAAVANAVDLGVVVVASAGNSGDRPYITGSPAATPGAISVAQTQVPGARGLVLEVNTPPAIAGIYTNTNTVEWAPVLDGFAGVVAYGQSSQEQLGCGPLASSVFGGKVALIDRGGCNISIKVHNAAEAGATGVLLANNAPGEAPSFSFGGPDPFTPAQTLVIGQEVGTRIKTQVANGVTVTVDPADGIPLAGSMASTSSRGPSMSFDAIKPEIGAPGASVSAEAGTGTGETAFGGTSGAAPMVAGAAALVLDAYPARTPLEVKAVLMNTADTDVQINPMTRPGELAEITRIGAGEVRVDDAVAARTAAWDSEGDGAALSFGYLTVHDDVTLKRTVLVRNYTGAGRTYSVTPEFRYADDRASGAVRFVGPRSVRVPAGQTKKVDVIMKIDASRLPAYVLDGGPRGGDGPSLATNEFDGYVVISGGGDTVHLPWHVLPHRAAEVTSPASVDLTAGTGSLQLSNTTSDSGLGAAVEVFALTGTSPQIPASELPAIGENRAVIDLRAVGVRGDAGVMQFGITTYGDRSHPNYPAEFDVYLDTNRDGRDDYVVYNADLGTGQNVVYVSRVGSGVGTAYYFTDANLNSANAILTVPMSAVGLSPGRQFDVSVYAFDNYFTGSLTDAITGMTFTVGTPRYAVGELTPLVEPGTTSTLTVTAPAGGATASPSQSGFLLLHRDGVLGQEAATVTVTD